MNILQLATAAGGGGAHKVASALYAGVRARGHGSWMAIGRGDPEDPDVFVIPSDMRQTPNRLLLNMAAHAIQPAVGRVRYARRIQEALRVASPINFVRNRLAGREYFDYPGSREILKLPPVTPDLVHGHNLHNKYFDLRYLAKLSRTVPVALTLHDEWTFTGHCAYGMGCARWRIGCGSCPDLTIYPAIRRDGTHENWLAKRAIYSDSRLYVSAPSAWLLDRARQSILAAGTVDWRLIPNGVDHKVFRPGDQAAARRLLRLPQEPLILLFAANLMGTNPFKDYTTVAGAVERVARQVGDRKLLLVALGGEGRKQRMGNAEIRFVPYETEPRRVAAYYQAADIYLHAANADTFPTTILEALSTGRPVVATAVGGIEEQVRSLARAAGSWTGPSVKAATATGILVNGHDVVGMAAATAFLLRDDALRAQLGRNAAEDAAARFNIETQMDTTLAWYAESIDDWHRWRGSTA
jgi:glycosyltransferase involved in cell wall biosynthesis